MYSQIGVTTGNSNTAVGLSSQVALTTGNANTAVGLSSQVALGIFQQDGVSTTQQAIGAYSHPSGVTTGNYKHCNWYSYAQSSID